MVDPISPLMPANNESRLIVALDFDNADKALALVDQLHPELCKLKVGKELFTSAGPGLVKELVHRGFDVFLDLKFHDIPNTCAKAVLSAANLGVWMVNVHAGGGVRMMRAAKEALDSYQGGRRPLLIGVTVLTSMDESDLAQLGIDKSPEELVANYAQLVFESGLDGVVCSAKECAMLKGRFGDGFHRVTPGIRPSGSVSDDQRRVVTPEEAMKLGSSYIVVGRPITQSENPKAVCEMINLSLQK